MKLKEAFGKDTPWRGNANHLVGSFLDKECVVAYEEMYTVSSKFYLVYDDENNKFFVAKDIEDDVPHFCSLPFGSVETLQTFRFFFNLDYFPPKIKVVNKEWFDIAKKWLILEAL